MATRVNLSVNPALKANDSGWYGPSGWARITSGVSGTLPRTTAWAGTTAGDVATPRVTVTAGLTYSASVSVYFTAASVGRTNIDWYGSGGTYLSSSPDVGFNQAAGTSNRLYTGVVTAPAGAVEGLLNVAGLDGAAQVTAVLWEQTGTSGTAYFDGDSVNSTWSGTSGNSTSTETTSNPISGLGALPGLRATAYGVRTSFGTGLAALPGLVGAIGLAVTVTYDDARGRIRISGSGMAATVIRAVVSSRPTGSRVWAEVRGGRVAVVNGRFTRTVDDFEFTTAATDYRIVGYSAQEDVVAAIVQQAVLPVATPLARPWVKFVPAPYYNRPVTLADWSSISRKARTALYEVRQRRDPVAVTDVHSSRSLTVWLRTATVDEGDALDEALGQGLPIFLHMPATAVLPSLYAVVGDYDSGPAGEALPVRIWKVAITEVAPPPLSIVGAGVTWATVLTRYATWDDLLAANATWADVMS